jgi:hypothetical protein
MQRGGALAQSTAIIGEAYFGRSTQERARASFVA